VSSDTVRRVRSAAYRSGERPKQASGAFIEVDIIGEKGWCRIGARRSDRFALVEHAKKRIEEPASPKTWMPPMAATSMSEVCCPAGPSHRPDERILRTDDQINNKSA